MVTVMSILLCCHCDLSIGDVEEVEKLDEKRSEFFSLSSVHVLHRSDFVV